MILRSHGNTPSGVKTEITPPCEITPSGVKSQSPVKSHPHMRSHGTPQTLKWHDSH